MKSTVCLVAVFAFALLAFGCGGKPQGGGTQTPPATGGATAAKTPDAEAGKKVFETHCITCHGTGGKGDGLAGKALNPPPRNFTDFNVMSGLTDDQLKGIIKNGKGGMPPWSAALKDEDIANVLFYVRHFARPQN